MLGIRQALDEVLVQSARAESARLDLGVQLKQTAPARREFLPQALLLGQAERGTQGDSSNASLSSTWKLPTGALLSAAVGRSMTRSPGALLAGERSVAQVTQSIGVTQPLLRGAGRDAAGIGLRQADLAVANARRDFVQVMSDLVFETVTAYFSLEQAGHATQLAREVLERAGKLRAVNEGLLEAGRIPRTALLQNDLDEAQARFSMAQAEQAETIARRTLLRLLRGGGRDPDSTPVVLGDSFAAHVDEAAPEEVQAIATALERRCDVLGARDALAAARLSLTSARDALRDQLDVYAKLDRLSPALPLSAPGAATSHAVGLQFSMVLDKSALRTAVDVAADLVAKAELAAAEVERNAEAETRDALAAIGFARAQYELAQRTAALAEHRMGDEVEKMRAGRSSAIELSQAQDALREARSQQEQARYAVFGARLALQRVTGTLLEHWGVADRVAQMLPAAP